MRGYILILLILCCAYAALSSAASVKKGCNRRYKGCRVMGGQCTCGVEEDCRNPWPYRSVKQCEKDLRGEADKCAPHPCDHGKCVQVLLEGRKPTRKWECACAGSGYHGKRCQLKCPPSDNAAPLPKDFPHDCIY